MRYPITLTFVLVFMVIQFVVLVVALWPP